MCANAESRSGSLVRNEDLENLSLAARYAARTGDWQTVRRSAKQILQRDPNSAEGHFLEGQAAKATGAPGAAERSFLAVLRIDCGRYDAAVELADVHVRMHRNREAVALLRSYVGQLTNSPVYLEMAALAYSRLDLHEEALPLYRRACELQPEIERFRTGLATCSVNLGRIGEARRIYEELLQRHPTHTRFHYELAQLRTATDSEHVGRMKAVLECASLPPEKKIFLSYALGKELEDLGVWDEAFTWYKKAGDAVQAVADYEVGSDIKVIDTLIETCDESWFRGRTGGAAPGGTPTPIFIIGLPRSGTTLVERIVASHSHVRSIGETFFLQIAVCREGGSATSAKPGPREIRTASISDMGGLASRYLEAVSYKLGDEPYFIEKFPENFLYLGFIAKAFPQASIVHVERHPMDVCFAMYKQSYFRFAYALDDVGHFYVAYDRLMRHWRSLLGERIIEVQYEDLVADSEGEIRRLIDRVGLEFEPACLAPEEHDASSRTASKVQIREPIHRRSIGRWKHFEHHLMELRDYLVAEGIEV